MKGAIIGDFVGSIYEGHHRNVPTKDFDFFTPACQYTDDTVMTVAVAEHLLDGAPLAPLLKRYYRTHPRRGYGRRFSRWASSDDLAPFNSLGNGSAMRVSPVAWWYDSLDEVLAVAKATAEVTHDHPEGIMGAQAIALATYLARTGASKQVIADAILEHTDYNPDMTLREAMAIYDRGASCRQSVPVALVAFFEATDFEDCLRNAVFAGGDSDTIAAMAGSIAEAFYGVPSGLEVLMMGKIGPSMREVVERFYAATRSRSSATSES